MIDALVIGGGIAGISLAARLAPHLSVMLVEGEGALGYHASGRSAALYEQTYGKPPTIALNEASGAYHRDGGYLSDRGLLLLGTKGQDEAFEADMMAMHMSPLTVAEAQGFLPILNPDAITHAGYHAEAWDIDTDRLIQDFARQVRAAGGQVVTGAKVTAITRTDQGWSVDTTGPTVEARLLINAAGAWADEIAKLAGVTPLGLQPLRRSMARIAMPKGQDVSRWPMIFGPGEAWYAKPDAGAMLVSPADEDPVPPQDAWAEDEVLAQGIAQWEAHVAPPVTSMLSNWAGLRTFAPDRCLCIGRDAGVDSFFWQAGQGGYGMQTSPAASQLGADLILGRPPQIAAPMVAAMDPGRFS